MEHCLSRFTGAQSIKISVMRKIISCVVLHHRIQNRNTTMLQLTYIVIY